MKKYKSIVQTDLSECYVCQKPYPNEWHHVFNGAMKSRSEEDGMMIYVHSCCHRFLHEHPMTNKTIKARCQRVWQAHYGDTDAFIIRYKKSYL